MRKKDKNQSLLKKEIGGREGPEPTRFGDWEKKGIISDPRKFNFTIFSTLKNRE